jgi:hypothetical protein
MGKFDPSNEQIWGNEHLFYLFSEIQAFWRLIRVHQLVYQVM